MVIITSKTLKKRSENDFYATPAPLAQAMVRRFVAPYTEFVLDPGCGDGAFGNALKEIYGGQFIKIDGVDPHSQVNSEKNPYNEIFTSDFLSWYTSRHYRIVIGNPPYRDAEEFVRHAWDLIAEDGQIIFLLKLAFLEGKARAKGLYKEMPPSAVHVLDRRPSFDGSGRTNDYAFAVFIWDRLDHSHKTKLEWLQW